MDLAAVAGMYRRKNTAAAAFADAQAQQAGGMATVLDTEQQRLACALADGLRALAEANRRLLERAIHVQGHVLGTVARAVACPSPRAQLLRYGASGAMAEAQRQPAVLFSARA